MKKHTKKWISIGLVISICLSIVSPVTVFAESTATQNETTFLEISSLPDNIRFLLGDAISELSAGGKTRNADASPQVGSNQLQVLNTDDLNSIQVEDGNGNGQAIVLGVPIRYTDEDGNVRFIDTSMTETDFLNSVFTEYDYQNTAGDTLFRFSKKPDKGIRVDKSFTYAIYNSDKRKLSKGYADQTIDGNGRMVYPEAFGKDTYVEYINTNTGIKENIVLETNVGQNRFEFVFESKEYVPILSEDQTVICVVHRDDPEDVKYCFSSLYVYDSFQPQEYDTIEAQPSQVPVYVGSAAGTPQSSTIGQSGAPEAKHYTTDNYYEVTQLSKGKYKITSVVSTKFLNDPNTVYPVVVDPGISSVSRDNNAQDTFVWENNPNNAGNGSLDYLRFGMKNGGRFHAYHRFTQLPNIGGSPYYVNITDATLKFTFRPGQTSGANGVCMIVTDHQWSESSLTWNNQPYGEWGYVSSHNNYQYYNFYVRPFVEMWYYGGYPNYGVDFTYDTMIDDYNSVVSSEGEVARAPQLSITYSTVPNVQMNTTYNRTLELGTARWFKFVPIQTDYYNIYTTGSVDTYGQIYQGTVLKDEDDDDGTGLNCLINCKLTKGTAYYIMVRGYDHGKVGDLSLRIESDFLNQLQKLHDLAKVYASDSDYAVELTMQFIRKETYNNPDSEWDKWDLAAGQIDQGFEDYVKSSPIVSEYFELVQGGYLFYYDSEGSAVDIPHLCATYNVLMYHSLGSLGDVYLAENLIDNLGGWGGDLRSIIPWILYVADDSTDFQTIYDKTTLLIGNPDYKFSMPDLYADVDAYNLYNLYNSTSTNSLKAVFSSYYIDGEMSTRFTDFTNGWSYEEIHQTVVAICQTSGVINLVWPLHKIANGEETNTQISLTATQVDAIATSFTDYIWEKVQLE